MTRKAVIRSGLVENVVLVEDGQWAPPSGTIAIDCGPEISRGDSYDGSNFIMAPKAAAVPSLDERAVYAVDGFERLIFEVFFDHENRVRVLESRPAITRAQFRTALIDRWKALNL